MKTYPSSKKVRRLADITVSAHAYNARALGGSVSAKASSGLWSLTFDLMLAGVWDSLYEVGIFAGVGNLNGCLAKLKSAPGAPTNLTNYNFVSGDVSASGLTGDGTTKYLSTGVTPSTFASPTSMSIGFHAVTSDYRTADVWPIGSNSSLGHCRLGTNIGSAAGWHSTSISTSGSAPYALGVSQAATSGVIAVSRTTNTDLRIFRNTSQIALNTADASTSSPYGLPATPLYLFARNNGSGAAEYRTTATLASYFIAKGLTPSRMKVLSDALNNYAKLFNANSY